MNNDEPKKPAHELLKSTFGLAPSEARDYLDRECLDDLDLRKEIQNLLQFRASDSSPDTPAEDEVSAEPATSESTELVPSSTAHLPADMSANEEFAPLSHSSTRRYFERLEGGARLACLLKLGDTYRAFVPRGHSGMRFVVLEHEAEENNSRGVSASLSQGLFLCLRSAGALSEAYGGSPVANPVTAIIASGQEARVGSRTHQISTAGRLVTVRELDLEQPARQPESTGRSRSRRRHTLEEIEAVSEQYFVFVDEDRSIEFTGRFTSDPFPHISQDERSIPHGVIGAFEEALRQFEGHEPRRKARPAARPRSAGPSRGAHPVSTTTPASSGAPSRWFLVAAIAAVVFLAIPLLLHEEAPGPLDPDTLFRTEDLLAYDPAALLPPEGSSEHVATGLDELDSSHAIAESPPVRSLSAPLGEDLVTEARALEIQRASISDDSTDTALSITKELPSLTQGNEENRTSDTSSEVVTADLRNVLAESVESAQSEQPKLEVKPAPQTLRVPGDFNRIQDAIDTARAGDTVSVGEGRYKETLVFKTGVTLEGAGRDRTLVISNSSHTILLVRDVTQGKIADMGFRHTNRSMSEVRFACISLVRSNVEIENCLVSSSDIHGLASTAGDKSTVRNCVFESNRSAGIYVSGEDTQPTLIGNLCRNNEFGVYLEGQAGGEVTDNRCDENQVGIAVSDAGTSPKIVENSCTENRAEGIHFRNGATGHVEKNVCMSNRNGIGVLNVSTKVTLVNNRCSNNEVQGIYFRDGSTGTATGNTCENNGQAGIMAFDPKTRLEARKNNCKKNHRFGVFFGNSAEGTAIANTCDENLESGIGVSDNATKAQLQDNVCSKNGRSGIVFRKGGQGAGKYNTCRGNRGFGIEVVDRGSSAELHENVCSENEKFGLYFGSGAAGTAQLNTCLRNRGSGIGVGGSGTRPKLIGNLCKENTRWGFAIQRGARPKIGENNRGTGNRKGLGLSQ